jgi:hypothetical protein
MRTLRHVSRFLMALFAQMTNVEYDRASTVVVLSLTLRAAGTVAGLSGRHSVWYEAVELSNRPCLGTVQSSRPTSPASGRND